MAGVKQHQLKTRQKQRAGEDAKGSDESDTGSVTERGTVEPEEQNSEHHDEHFPTSSGRTRLDPHPHIPQYVAKRRARRKAPRADLEDAADAVCEKGITTILPALQCDTAPTFEQFDARLVQYCEKNHTMLVVRDSNTRDARNEKLEASYENRREKASAKGRQFKDKLHLIPEDFVYFKRVYLCVHSNYQQKKSAGADNPDAAQQRQQASTLFSRCPARVTAMVKRDTKTGAWSVHKCQENVVHNHPCTKEVARAYDTQSIIDDEVLLARVPDQIAAGGNSRVIRDQLSADGDAPFSQKKFQNLRDYRLGGGDAKANLESLLEQLENTQDARCLLIHDQDKAVTGVLFQTGIQREFVKRFGDSLVLDWTHSTNNLGLHLGTLMATSVTGKGVPVYNFLCLSQGVQTMSAVLRLFLDGCPEIADLLESIVIDKDYKEWKALNMVFDGAKVVLCQFHVIKWFKTVVADARYHIPKPDRARVIKIVREMVYAETRDAFEAVQSKLHDLLSGEEHAAFHRYMQTRWFAIKAMWANHERGRIFTAGNTTSNRLESHWNQLKAGLRKYKRIDKCLEAIIIRESAIVRREYEELSRASTRTPLLVGDHAFVRPLLRDLCTSRMELVRKQWVKYLARASKYYTTNSSGTDLSIGVSSRSDMTFTVTAASTAPWTCSCRFGSSNRLPCRHQFFVAKAILRQDSFPVDAVHRRWRVSANSDLVELLAAASEELAPIRLVLASGVGGPRNAIKTEGIRVPLPRLRKKVRIVSLPRHTVGNLVVLEATEKRNVIESQCSRVVSRLTRLGTARFWEASAAWEEVVTTFLSRLDITDAAPHHIMSRPGTAGSSSLTDEHGVRSARAASEDRAVERASSFDDSTTEQVGSLPVATPMDVDCEEKEPDGDGELSPVNNNDTADCIDESEYGNIVLDGDVSDDDEEDQDCESTTGLPAASSFDDLVMGAIWDGLSDAAARAQPYDPSLLPIPFPSPAPDEQSVVRFQPRDDAPQGDSVPLAISVLSPSTLGNVRFPTNGLHEGNAQTPTGLEAFSWVGHGWPGLTPTSATASASATQVDESEHHRHTSPPKRKHEGSIVDDTPHVKRVRKGIFDEFSLPTATAGAPRNSKQLSKKATRLQILLSEPQCPVSVDEFVIGLQHSSLSAVGELLARYPRRYEDDDCEERNISVALQTVVDVYQAPGFVLTKAATDKLVAAFKTKKAEDNPDKQNVVFDEGATQYVASFYGIPGSFSEQTVAAFTRFHDMRLYVVKYTKDTDWLKTNHNWVDVSKSSSEIGFLDSHGATSLDDGNDSFLDGLLTNTKANLNSLTLATTLATNASNLHQVASIPAVELLGRVSGKTWLNDSIVYFALCVMAAGHADVTILDPLRTGRPPAGRLVDQRVVVFPVNILNAHWCAFYVLPRSDGKHDVFSYDPQCDPKAWGKHVDAAWDSWVRPFLNEWFSRDAQDEQDVADLTKDAPKLHGLETMHRTMLCQPKQFDDYNCGVFVLGVAHSYIEANTTLRDRADLTPANLQLMRLRILHMMTSKTARSADSALKASGDDAITRFQAHNVSTKRVVTKGVGRTKTK